MIGLVVMIAVLIVIPTAIAMWLGMHIEARDRDALREEKRRAEREEDRKRRKEE